MGHYQLFFVDDTRMATCERYARGAGLRRANYLLYVRLRMPLSQQSCLLYFRTSPKVPPIGTYRGRWLGR